MWVGSPSAAEFDFSESCFKKVLVPFLTAILLKPDQGLLNSILQGGIVLSSLGNLIKFIQGKAVPFNDFGGLLEKAIADDSHRVG